MGMDYDLALGGAWGPLAGSWSEQEHSPYGDGGAAN
jgi:hypothetical protein